MKNFWLDVGEDVGVLGTFENESGVLRVSDPCYDKDVWCADTVTAVTGKWKAKVVYGEEGRVAALICQHDSLDDIEPDSHLWELKTDAGVDSGQCGVFDDRHFKSDSQVVGLTRVHDKTICDDEPFYSFCCDRTLGDKQAGVLPYGAVSSSGWGDGGYPVYVVPFKFAIPNLNAAPHAGAVMINYMLEL